MDIYLKVHHILAIGRNKRFMCIKFDDGEMGYSYIRISLEGAFFCN